MALFTCQGLRSVPELYARFKYEISFTLLLLLHLFNSHCFQYILVSQYQTVNPFWVNNHHAGFAAARDDGGDRWWMVMTTGTLRIVHHLLLTPVRLPMSGISQEWQSSEGIIYTFKTKSKVPQLLKYTIKFRVQYALVYDTLACIWLPVKSKLKLKVDALDPTV